MADQLLAHEAFVRRVAARLLRDASRVDDVVQQTWLAALRRRPDASVGLGGWLARVARNFALESRRGDARREDRERRAARAERLPSVESIRAREAARHAVVEAVLALDEPFRSAVLLRFLDGLPPRAVARALGVPVETARSRVRRGLEHVRARLDRERGGDGRAWALALAAIAAMPAPGGAAIGRALEHVVEGISMGTKAKVSIAAAALLALAGAWWQLGERAEPERARDALARRAGDGPARAPESGGGASAPATAGGGDASRERVAAAEPRAARPASSAALGSARVRATWASDKTPAANVSVRASTFERPGGQFAWDVPRGVTNEAGELFFERLPIGETYFDCDRGTSMKADIRAGETAAVAIELPRGFGIEVTVVDPSGAPVEGAEIWLSRVYARASQGDVVGRTGKQGTFLVRDLRHDACVAARSDRLGPSRVERVTGSESATVPLRLQLAGACGEVRGRVLDADGAPVGEGWMLVGDEEPSFARGDDGVVRWKPTGACVPIENGRFVARGVPTGAVAYTARAAAGAPTRGVVDVAAGEVVEIEVRLVRGGAIAGRALDAGGRPVDRAQITVGYVGTFDAVATWTAKDGTYRLEGVPAGDVEAFAWKEIRESTSAKLAVPASGEARWDPILPRADRAIRGRVVDERGLPLAKWRVVAHLPYLPAMGASEAASDDDGRFEIGQCGEGEHVVEAFEPWSAEARRDPTRMLEFPSAGAEHVVPGGDDVVIAVPDSARKTASLVGVVVDAEGKPVANARVSLGRKGDFMTYGAVNDANGAFRFAHLPGGANYAVRVEKDGFPALERVVEPLAPGRVTDLGALKLVPGGTVRIELRREDGKPLEGNLSISAEPQSAKGAGVWIDERAREGDRIRSQPLAPGAYRLRVYADGAACALPEFEIRTGAETRLAVTLRSGFDRTVRVARPAEVTIRDADGRIVWTDRIRAHAGGAPHESFTLAPGAYRIEAVADDGARGEATFAVAGPAKEGEAIDVTLR